MTAAPLYLLHTQPDPRLLAAWTARTLGRRPVSDDLGDALHGLLRACFGDAAPQPYCYLDARQGLLAYTRLDPDALRGRVVLAEPQAAQALGLSAHAGHGGYRLRAFPSQWPQDHRLRFEVRVRPTVREGRTGRERDAFLHAVEHAQGAPLLREAVYARWLREHLGRREGAAAERWQGAVELLDVRLVRYRQLDVVRRTQRREPDDARQGRVVAGPDAVLAGELRVLDPAGFHALVARGVGRHRAFGFGMLLLRPAG